MRSFASSSIARSEDLSSPEAKQNRIVSILKEKFQPVDLQVQDISGMWSALIVGGCGSFFAILLKSKAFDGKSTIQAHRMVNKEIKEVIQGIHGLQVRFDGSFSSRPWQPPTRILYSAKRIPILSSVPRLPCALDVAHRSECGRGAAGALCLVLGSSAHRIGVIE